MDVGSQPYLRFPLDQEADCRNGPVKGRLSGMRNSFLIVQELVAVKRDLYRLDFSFLNNS
jgi:hypothetical protein